MDRTSTPRVLEMKVDKRLRVDTSLNEVETLEVPRLLLLVEREDNSSERAELCQTAKRRSSTDGERTRVRLN